MSPYIDKIGREMMDAGAPPLTPGDLNYQLATHIDVYLAQFGVNYGTINAVIGVLECLKLEAFRRIAAPYEQSKLEENGEVFISAGTG